MDTRAWQSTDRTGLNTDVGNHDMSRRNSDLASLDQAYAQGGQPVGEWRITAQVPGQARLLGFSDNKLKTIRSVMNIRDSNVLMPPWMLQDALEVDRPR